jgi:hypothetical protein
MAAASAANNHAADATTFADESTTQIVAVINRLDGDITLRDSEAPDSGVTISSGTTAGCQLRLDRTDGAECSPDRHIEVRINQRGSTATRFWLWQADGEIRYSRRQPHDPKATTVPGNALTGGDRVLTINVPANGRGRLWRAIWRRLRLMTRRRLRARPGLHLFANGRERR